MGATKSQPRKRAENAAVLALALGMGMVTFAVGFALRALEQECRKQSTP